jgi:drug/metabolite transporter (DMT)-like permease
MMYRGRLVFPALVAAGILWGTTVPLSKLALAWLAPGWLAFARFALAAAVLGIASRSRLRAALSPAILITGAAGYGGSVLLQNFGIERTSVTHAALLIGATPVLVAVLAAAAGQGVARPLAWAGLGLSLAGVGFIAGGQGAGSSLGGDGLVLAGQLAAAGFTVSQARLLPGRDPVAVTALQLMAAAVAMLPAALIGGHAPAHAGSMTAMLATAALVLAGTVAPTTMFAFGQSRVSADVAGAFLNLEPLVGALTGVVAFGNPLGPVQIAGGAAIASGIALSACQVARTQRGQRSEPLTMLPVRADWDGLAAVAGPARPAGSANTASTPGAAPATSVPLVRVASVASPADLRWPAPSPAPAGRVRRPAAQSGRGSRLHARQPEPVIPGRAGGPVTPARPGARSGAEPHRRSQRQIARRPADVHGELAAWRNPAGQRLVVPAERPGRDREPDFG